MSEHNITVEGGESVRLPTAGKYCDRDIVITANGQDTSDANATATDIRQGASAYADGEKIEGSLRVAYGGIQAEVEPYDKHYMGSVGMEKIYDDPIAIYPQYGSTVSLFAPYEAFGDATAADVAKGKTFTGAGGFMVEGEAEIGGGSYEIFGSHVIAPEWSGYYIVPEEDVTIGFSENVAIARFKSEEGDDYIDSIDSIQFRSDGTITIRSLHTPYILEYDGSDWKATIGEGYDEFFWDIGDQNRVIEFFDFAEVTKEEYTLLQGLLACDADMNVSAYGIGYDRGYDKGFADNAPSTPTDNRTTLRCWYQYLADDYSYDLSACKLVDVDREDPVPIELEYPTGTQNVGNVMELVTIYVYAETTIPDGNEDDVDVYVECKLPVSKFTGTLDVASCSHLNYTFLGLEFLEDAGEIINTGNITQFVGTFYGCSALTTTPELDVRNGTTFTNMFSGCTNLTDIRLRNIKANLTVSNALLTVDSLVHLIYELRKTNSTIKTLSMGSANLKKLANVYVKRITITDEMRAEDDLIDQKLPFVVCESTDEGAMLITNYVLSKYWKLS